MFIRPRVRIGWFDGAFLVLQICINSSSSVCNWLAKGYSTAWTLGRASS
jgi:hypothetical protein